MITLNKNFLFRNRILWHILFWLFIYSFYVVTYGEYQDDYKGELLVNLYLLPVRMLGTYSLIYFIIPKFLLAKRFLPFLVISIIHALIYGSLIWLCILKVEVFGAKGQSIDFLWFNWGSILTTIADNYKIPAIAALVKIFKKWYSDQITKQKLINEKQKAELSFLKNQIHPHFLFNTLNNLYSLTLEKSDEAPNVVVKLSEMLSYILYECNVDHVNMEKEMKFVENYISLQKIRHNEELVKIDLSITVDDYNKKIAPLIVLPLIENCFKHGVDKNPGNAFIKIDISCENNIFTIETSNTKVEETTRTEKKEGGVGLQNVKRRLEFLYKNNYSLDIGTDDFQHNLKLKINLPDATEAI